MSHELITMLLLQQIRQAAATHPQNFEEIMQVGQGDSSSQHGRIRAVYQDMRTVARERQRALLKKPLQELVTQLQEKEIQAEAGTDE